MLDERAEGLRALEAAIGNTPLLQVPAEVVAPSGSLIFGKAEYTNPSGSHYDRIYAVLFRVLLDELEAGLQEPAGLVEISSGNAGASFVWFCKQLAFEGYLVLPRGLPTGFLDHIRALNPNARLILSDTDDWLEGANRKLREFLMGSRNGSGQRYWVMNHSERPQSLIGSAKIGHEIVAQLESLGHSGLDFLVLAVGNGTTIVGPVPVIKSWCGSTKVVCFEHLGAPVGYNAKYASKIAGSSYAHGLVGTGAWGLRLSFLHDPAYGFRDMVDEVRLVKQEEVDMALQKDFGLSHSIGRTSKVALWLASSLAKEWPGSRIAVLLYDDGSKYV